MFPSGGVGQPLDLGANLAFGVEPKRNADGRAQLPGERIHAPGLEVHLALSDQAARSGDDGRTVVANATPGQRTEEPDHVVLGAVALPVVRDHGLASASLAWALGQSKPYRLYLGHQSLAVLPRDRFPEQRIGGDLSQ